MIEYKDSAGNLLIETGVHTSEAIEHLHICFDDHPLIGRRAWLYETRHAREYVLKQMENGVEPCFGSKGWGVANTGLGYKVNPEWIFALDFGLLPHEEKEEQVIQRIFDKWKYKYRKASLDEDKYLGVDYVTTDSLGFVCSFQIKRREKHQKWDYIFLQTHESNPDKQYK